jgi:hypothetical protein
MAAVLHLLYVFSSLPVFTITDGKAHHNCQLADRGRFCLLSTIVSIGREGIRLAMTLISQNKLS